MKGSESPIYDPASGNPFAELPTPSYTAEMSKAAMETALQELDKFANVPDSVDEEMWHHLCHYRRQKVDSEHMVSSFIVLTQSSPHWSTVLVELSSFQVFPASFISSSTVLLHVPSGQSLLHVPSGQSLLHVPSGQSLLHVPSGQSLLHVPSGQSLLHVPSGLFFSFFQVGSISEWNYFRLFLWKTVLCA